MNQPLEDKVVLIMGGSGSIGAATALRFAELGARVAISHRDGLPAAAAAVSLVKSFPGEGHVALSADVARTDTLKALRAEIAQRFGRLDVLVNAAGFTKPVPHADLEALDDDLIDRMFAVNWRGQFATIRTFAPLLKASGNGLIVSISSIAGATGVGSSIAYCAAKAGIDIMTKSLARVLAPEVRVLAVAPGVVDTDFVPGRGPDFNAKTASTTPLKRIATAEDIASAVIGCAIQLGFATGTTLVVDGGRSL
jgi:3-oxoacyl-[acyl-carrier protein] reductase